jgi:hypothetical protein
MQKTLLICAAMVMILTAGSCKKKNSTPVDTGNYQPITSGSEWNYTVTGTSTAIYKLTATGIDTLINGRIYKIFFNSGGANEYYNKTGYDYYRYTKLAEFNNQPVELLYLNENLPKASTWVETKTVNVSVTGLGIVAVTAQFTFTVAEKGIDYMVNGVTFKDVIKITAVPSFTALGSPVPVASSDLQYFYARNIGLINSKTSMNIPLASININTETRIGAYLIK